MAIDQKTKKGAAYKSPWVWAALGLLLTVFTVNYGFVMVSSSTWGGLVNEEYYKYGLQQNKIDKQYRKQAVRGWQVNLPEIKSWQAGKPETLHLYASDKAGNPLTKGRAEVTAYRPSDAKQDVIVQLNETDQPGHYTAELSMPLAGVWDLNLLFSLNDDKHMMNRRITVTGGDAPELSPLEKVVNFLSGE